MAKDYYDILELPRDATPTDIKKAYHRLSRKWHPDKNPGKEIEAKQRFQDIAEAYQVLTNASTRHRYDFFSSTNTDWEGSFDIPPEFFKTADELFREFFDGMTLDEVLDEFLNDQYFKDLTELSSAYKSFGTVLHEVSNPTQRSRTTGFEGTTRESATCETRTSEAKVQSFWQLFCILLSPVILMVQITLQQIIQAVAYPIQPLLIYLLPVYRLVEPLPQLFLKLLYPVYVLLKTSRKFFLPVVQIFQPILQSTRAFLPVFQSIYNTASMVTQPFSQLFTPIVEVFKSFQQAFQFLIQLPRLIHPLFELFRILFRVIAQTINILQGPRRS